MVLGKEVMDRYDLLPLKDVMTNLFVIAFYVGSFFLIIEFLIQGFLKGYDAKVDPNLPSSFFAAAYRYGHSNIPGAIERWSPTHKFIGNINNKTFYPYFKDII